MFSYETFHLNSSASIVLIYCYSFSQVDGEAFDIKILYNPGYYAYASFSKDSITLDGKPSREPSQMEGKWISEKLG